MNRRATAWRALFKPRRLEIRPPPRRKNEPGFSGVLAYPVARQTNEIGIRRALGAQVHDVLRLVIRQGMKLVLIGLVIGTAGGYAVKRLITSKIIAPANWQRIPLRQA